MNYIEITGGRKKQRELVENAVITLCNKFLKRFKLEFEIELINCDAHGYCIWNETNVNPRSFLITLHKGMDDNDLLKTLAHEMVHVKQYVKGELKERYKDGHKQLWMNKDYSDASYDDQPWEIEAHELENEWVKIINN